MWIDTHCHLTASDDAAESLAEAARDGVETVVVVGTTVADSSEAIALAAAHPGVFATAGVHPHDASGGMDGLADLLAAPEVVAVGECGLDYHYLHSPADVQRRVFAHQIGLAVDRGLPLVVHTREAWDDTAEILAAEAGGATVVIHCFSGGPTEARRLLDLGVMLSFSGIVTFNSADDVREAVRLCPLDRLLVETDSPYLAPVPYRGKPNRPALVPLVGAAVAATKGVSVDEVESATWATAGAFYGFDDD